MGRGRNTNRTAAEETQTEEETLVEDVTDGQAVEEETPTEEETPVEETPVDERESEEPNTGAGFPRNMDDFDGKKISVETTGDFQLFDATTQTLFPHNKSVKVPANSPFVIRNIERGKLKKA
jgi:hypothetical protein